MEMRRKPAGSLTAGEAAARIGLHAKTLRQKLRDGVLEGRLEHGRWVVEEAELMSYVAQAGYGDTRGTDGPAETLLVKTPASPSKAAGRGSSSVVEAGPMADRETERNSAWLLLAVGENRAFGSNDGYKDEPARCYRWDSTVANHGQIREGDPVVLWDKKGSIGAAVVDSIETAENTKSVYSCPHCGKAHIKERKRIRPRYRCFKCGTDFDVPITTRKEVLEYTGFYEKSWVDLGGMLDGGTLRRLCVKPKSQLSLRPLRWDEFRKTVAGAGGPELLTVLDASKGMIDGGHRTANVRVRVGQDAFRRDLLATMGPICAFTGPTPVAALEAAHLYSYAQVSEHRKHGGLLMRRDLHRLFDLGFIAVNPYTLTIDVASSLAHYPAYAALEGRPLSVALRKQQVAWLREHWAEHRSGSVASR